MDEVTDDLLDRGRKRKRRERGKQRERENKIDNGFLECRNQTKISLTSGLAK